MLGVVRKGLMPWKARGAVALSIALVIAFSSLGIAAAAPGENTSVDCRGPDFDQGRIDIPQTLSSRVVPNQPGLEHRPLAVVPWYSGRPLEEVRHRDERARPSDALGQANPGFVRDLAPLSPDSAGDQSDYRVARPIAQAAGVIRWVDLETGCFALQTRVVVPYATDHQGERPELSHPGVMLVLKATEETKIVVNGEHGSLADITVPAKAMVVFNPRTREALSIRAKTHQDRHVEAIGVIRRVDPESGHFAFHTRKGERQLIGIDHDRPELAHTGVMLVLKATEETKIVVNGEHGSLADITVPAKAMVVFNPRTREALSIRAETHHGEHAEVVGVIRRVDPHSGRFILQTRFGERYDDSDERVRPELTPTGVILVLKATEETEIVVNGEPGTLADISVPAKAMVVFNRRTMTALSIRARTHEAEHAKAAGVIRRIDLESGRFALQTRIRDHRFADADGLRPDVAHSGVILVLKATEETEIVVNGEPGTLADISVPAKAMVVFNPRTMEAYSMRVATSDGDSFRDFEEPSTVRPE